MVSELSQRIAGLDTWQNDKLKPAELDAILASQGDFQKILGDFAAEIEQLPKDAITSEAARESIGKLLDSIYGHSFIDEASAKQGIENLKDVSKLLIVKIRFASSLSQADFDILAKRIQNLHKDLQDVIDGGGSTATQNVNATPNKGTVDLEKQALDAIEEKLKNSVEKGKQAITAISTAVAVVDVRSPYTFDYVENGRNESQKYPTLYDLADEIIDLENDDEFKKLTDVAKEQKTSLVANPYSVAAEKWSKEISQLKTDMTAQLELIFNDDGIVKDLIQARTNITSAGTLFTNINLSGQVIALENAITAVRKANFPRSSVQLRDAELAQSETLLKNAKLSEWMRTLNTTSPNLFVLIDKVKKYPTGWTTTFNEKSKELKQLRAAAAAEISGLDPEKDEYYRANLEPLIENLSKEIAQDLQTEGANMSSDKYQYETEKALLEALDDWELVEATLKGASRVHIEEHGSIDMSRPLEKAAYDVLKARMFTAPEVKRKEVGYRNTDLDGNEKFDKWLVARARMSLGAFTRKFVDSGAVRSNVGLWKDMAPEGKSEITMYAYLMNRGPLMLETYHHPVMGPFFTEVMERMLVQGSLRKGVIAVRNAEGKYFPRRHSPGAPIPQSQIDSGEIIVPDKDFNYDRLHQTSKGLAVIVEKKVLELVNKLAPEFGLPQFYKDIAPELIISIFCGFNYVDVISSSAQERTQTPISPRTGLVSSIEAVQNLAANMLHTLLRYNSPRKPQNWYSVMFNFEEHYDAIGPEVDKYDGSHEKDIHLLKDVTNKVVKFFEIFFANPSALKRNASPGKLGRISMAPLAHSLGVPNMHETLMNATSDEVLTRENIEVRYDYDKYMQTLSLWSRFVDLVIKSIPSDLTVEKVEASAEAGGLIDDMITKILAVAKLVPGTHYDMVPMMLYMTSLRLVSKFQDKSQRMQVLTILKTRFSEACIPGKGLDAFAKQMAPLLKLFGVGNLSPAEKAELTYGGFHADFAPTKDTAQRKAVLASLTEEWHEKQHGKPVPPVIDYARPPWLEWGKFTEYFGDIEAAAKEFYERLENLDPEGPCDRTGVVDDAKKA